MTKSPGLTSTSPLVVLELLDRDEAFGLESGVDDDDVVVDADDFGGDELALPHFLPGKRFLEQGGEIFGRGGVDMLVRGGSHDGLVPSVVINRRMREPCVSRGGLVVEIRG